MQKSRVATSNTAFFMDSIRLFSLNLTELSQYIKLNTNRTE
jgi:hypothetical protein